MYWQRAEDRDVQTPLGWTKVQVIWDLSVTELDDPTGCLYTNVVVSYPTRGFLDILARTGQAFDETVTDRQHATDDHNERETPRCAASIEREH